MLERIWTGHIYGIAMIILALIFREYPNEMIVQTFTDAFNLSAEFYAGAFISGGTILFLSAKEVKLKNYLVGSSPLLLHTVLLGILWIGGDCSSERFILFSFIYLTGLRRAICSSKSSLFICLRTHQAQLSGILLMFLGFEYVNYSDIETLHFIQNLGISPFYYGAGLIVFGNIMVSRAFKMNKYEYGLWVFALIIHIYALAMLTITEVLHPSVFSVFAWIAVDIIRSVWTNQRESVIDGFRN
jgi:hypothetical protein